MSNHVTGDFPITNHTGDEDWDHDTGGGLAEIGRASCRERVLRLV